MECAEISYSGHAVRRMFERNLVPAEVRTVIEHGEIIADYPDDQPFPSFLLLGWSRGRPVHVVVAWDKLHGKCFMVPATSPTRNYGRPILRPADSDGMCYL